LDGHPLSCNDEKIEGEEPGVDFCEGVADSVDCFPKRRIAKGIDDWWSETFNSQDVETGVSDESLKGSDGKESVLGCFFGIARILP
jgi:hypothetical protein